MRWQDAHNEAAAEALDAADDEALWRADQDRLHGIDDARTPTQRAIAEHLAIANGLPDDDPVDYGDWAWPR